MSTRYKISEVGELVGLSAKTIRFYEEINLIPLAQRAENGYRLYDSSIIQELELIKYARDMGMSIEKIRQLVKGCEDGCDHSKEQVKKDITEYINVLEEKISQLQMLQEKLLKLNKYIEKHPCSHDKYCCNVLFQLLTLEKGGEHKMTECTCTTCTCENCKC